MDQLLLLFHYLQCLLVHYSLVLFLYGIVLLSLPLEPLFGLCLFLAMLLGWFLIEVQAAQVDEIEVARRDIIGLVVLDLVGKEFNKTEKPQHTSWDYLCMLVHVCGRGCIDLGSLVSQVLIAKGSGAIDKVMMAILFIPRLVWVDIGVAQAHVSRSAC